MEETKIIKIHVLPLAGEEIQFATIEEAIAFIDKGQFIFDEFVRVELQVYYNNDDSVNGYFKDRERAISFLENVQSWS